MGRACSHGVVSKPGRVGHGSRKEEVGDFLDCVLAEDVLSVDKHLGPTVCQGIDVRIAAIGQNSIPKALAVVDDLGLLVSH